MSLRAKNQMRLASILREEGLLRKTAGSQEEDALLVEGLAKKLKAPGTKRSEEPLTFEERYGTGKTKKKVLFTKGPGVVEVEIEMVSSWPKPSLKVEGKSADGKEVWDVFPREAARQVDRLEGYVEKPEEVNARVLEMLEIMNQADVVQQDPSTLVAAARSVKTPEGFQRKEGWGHLDGSYLDAPDKKDWYFVHLESEDVRVTANFTQTPAHEGLQAEGRTDFKIPNRGWQTLARRGPSFRLGKYGKPVKQANQVISDQIKKAKATISKYAKPVEVVVDGSRFTLTQERLKQLQDLLKKKGGFTLNPGGYGTGYYIWAKKPRGRHGVGQAPKEFAELFGVSRLYFERFDHD